MFARGVRYKVSFKRLAVKEDLTNAFADAVRILDLNLILGSAEAAGNCVLLPL